MIVWLLLSSSLSFFVIGMILFILKSKNSTPTNVGGGFAGGTMINCQAINCNAEVNNINKKKNNNKEIIIMIVCAGIGFLGNIIAAIIAII